MMTNSRLIAGLVVLAMAAFAMRDFVLGADEKEAQTPRAAQKTPQSKPVDKELSHFMRLKLEASGKVLEGLATEDFTLVKEGAGKLNEMSTAEKWRVSNDALYRNFSGDFQRVTKELVEAANDKNLDRAALKWMNVTMQCIECHRFARGIRMASN